MRRSRAIDYANCSLTGELCVFDMVVIAVAVTTNQSPSAPHKLKIHKLTKQMPINDSADLPPVSVPAR